MPSHASEEAYANERGFTLVEMIVVLALLALISLAGLALVNSVLAARTRTQGRLDRLADIERAMYLIGADLGQIAEGPITADPHGVGFSRTGGRGALAARRIGYALGNGTIERIVDGQPQHLLDGVASARWSFLVADRGWRTGWPPSPQLADAWPAAIAVDIALASRPDRPTGTLRRVVALPAHP